MPDKLTDKEIIKALECCSNDECSKCPFQDGVCSEKDVMKNSLDLINRQEAKIERLKEKSREDDKLLNDRVQEAVNAVSEANQKYVDSLEKRIEDYKHLDVILHTAIDKLAKDLKAEAYKECIEKVKETLPKDDFLRSTKYISKQLDNLLNELVGDGN